jgi:hypothetical protein
MYSAIATRMPLDDAPLRRAAADLIAAAKLEVPMIGLALCAVEQGLGTLTVEVAVGQQEITTLLVFDDGGDRETVLLSLGT